MRLDLANRERLLGARMYTSPTLYQVSGRSASAIRRPTVVPAGTNMTARVTCPAGQYVITHQYFHGMLMLLRQDGSSVQVAESEEVAKERVVGPHFLIRYSDGTPTTVEFKANGAVPPDLRTIRPDGLACLDARPLQRQITTSQTPSSLMITPSRVDARFSQPHSGRLVVATPAADGWRCRADGRNVPIEPLAGMLSVKASGIRNLDCTYRPPGLTAGIVLGAVSLSLTALLAAAGRRRVLRKAGTR